MKHISSDSKKWAEDALVAVYGDGARVPPEWHRELALDRVPLVRRGEVGG